MTKSIFATSLIAISAFTSFSTFAQEAPMVVEGYTTFQERVNFRDLDLRETADRSALNKRVWAAADRVCLAAEGPNYYTDTTVYGTAGVPAGLNCAGLTVRAANPQIRAAIRSAESGRSLAMASFVIAMRVAK
jgi:UrcA family protein